MRIPVFVFAVALTTGAMVCAQTAPGGKAATTTPPSAAASAALDAHLLRWEQEMRKIQTFSAAITRIDKDKSFGTKTTLNGVAQFMRSGTGMSALNLAYLELRLEGKPVGDFEEKFISTGTYLYRFLPKWKVIEAHEMPKPKAGAAAVGDNASTGLLFGMKAEEAKRRYEMTLYKVDAHYVYVDIVPRFPADKADFTRARLVLFKDSYLPRQLWFELTGGKDQTWDIPRSQVNTTLDRRVFDAPRVPAGWKLVPVTRPTTSASTVPPRVIRSKE